MELAGRWTPLVILVLCMSLLQLIGPEIFRLEPRLVNEWQLWRVLTGHWVHANWVHYGLNMSGLILCLALTGVNWSIWHWLWRILVLSLGISLGLYQWYPDINWYVGFSGVLFGLYVLCAYASLKDQLMMSSLILLFIAIKIILEQWSSVKISTSELIGVPVMVDAHFYGVVIAVAIIVFNTILIKYFKTRG